MCSVIFTDAQTSVFNWAPLLTYAMEGAYTITGTALNAISSVSTMHFSPNQA